MIKIGETHEMWWKYPHSGHDASATEAVKRLVEVMESIRDADQTDMALDPEWPARQARAALAKARGE